MTTTTSSTTFILYPNPNFGRGTPPGEPGTVELGGRVIDAVKTAHGEVWVRVLDSQDWHCALSTLTRETFVGWYS